MRTYAFRRHYAQHPQQDSPLLTGEQVVFSRCLSSLDILTFADEEPTATYTGEIDAYPHHDPDNRHQHDG